MTAIFDITEANLRSAGFRPLVAGDDYPMGFTAKRGGSAINLASGKVWITIKDDPIQADAEAQLQMDSDTPADIDIDDATNGHFIVHFHATASPNTADLGGKWLYDIQIKEASGDITTWGKGEIEFLSNVTRTTS